MANPRAARTTTRVWVCNPHSGGTPLTATAKVQVERRLRSHAEQSYAGLYTSLLIRFRGALCYISATVPGSDVPLNLCRLRHFSNDTWSVAFFAYSSERYEPCMLQTGEFWGTPEQGFDVGAVYLAG